MENILGRTVEKQQREAQSSDVYCCGQILKIIFAEDEALLEGSKITFLTQDHECYEQINVSRRTASPVAFANRLLPE